MRLFVFVFFALLFGSEFFMLGCASIKRPEGGPRDTIAPEVVKEFPKNYTVNFKSNKIIIQMDEFFKLQNQSKEFSVSPEMPKAPILRVNKKALEIEIQDTLEKNITYTMNFGEMIQDVNESNKLLNYTYVFATGPKLDSLQLSGSVMDGLTLKNAEKGTLVFLVPVDRDTILGKKRPSIYTYTDSSGRFQLKNLRKEAYHLYAIEDKGGDKIYQANTDQLAFASETIFLNRDTAVSPLKLFRELPPKYLITNRQINSDGSIGIVLNKPNKTTKITVLDPKELEVTKQVMYSKGRDTIKLWLTNMDFDSVRLQVQNTDTIMPSFKLTKSKNVKYKRDLLIKDNVPAGTLALGRYYEGEVNFPLENVDPKAIELLEDSVKRTNFNLVRDTANVLKYSIQYPFKFKKNYIINYSEGALQGKYGTKNTKFSSVFKLASNDDFGTLTVKFKRKDTIHKNASYLIQLLNIEDYKVLISQAIHADTTIAYKNFPAKKYFLRVVYDTNQNQEWDPGNVITRTQPEKVWIAPKQMYLRANWETEETIEIPMDEDSRKDTVPENTKVILQTPATLPQKQKVTPKNNLSTPKK